MLRSCFFLASLALTGCRGGTGPAKPGVSADPVVTAALNERIVSDPDLVTMNDADAVLAMPNPLFDRLPPFDRSDDEFGRSRDAALTLVGGKFETLPEPDAAGPALDGASPLTMAAALPSARSCLAGARSGAIWAASTSLPIVPRGHVLAASGNDAGRCHLRAVRFVSALPLDDLLGFYAAKARMSGFSVTRRRAGEAEQIEGDKGGSALLVHARKRADGLTQADLVTLN